VCVCVCVCTFMRAGAQRNIFFSFVLLIVTHTIHCDDLKQIFHLQNYKIKDNNIKRNISIANVKAANRTDSTLP